MKARVKRPIDVTEAARANVFEYLERPPRGPRLQSIVCPVITPNCRTGRRVQPPYVGNLPKVFDN